jgi:hypothetical protein
MRVQRPCPPFGGEEKSPKYNISKMYNGCLFGFSLGNYKLEHPSNFQEQNTSHSRWKHLFINKKYLIC